MPIGREAEAAKISRFLGELPRGPRVLLIEGEAGIGKTTLLREGQNNAVRLGIMVLSAFPAESEVPLEFAGLADLLEWVPAVLVDGLPVPQRQAVRQAVLRAEPPNGQRIRGPRQQRCLRCFAAWPRSNRCWLSSMTCSGSMPLPPARCPSRCAACGLSPWACWRRCGRTGRQTRRRWLPTASRRNEWIACGSGRSARGDPRTAGYPDDAVVPAGRFSCGSTRHPAGIRYSRLSWPRGLMPISRQGCTTHSMCLIRCGGWYAGRHWLATRAARCAPGLLAFGRAGTAGHLRCRPRSGHRAC